MPWRHWIRRRFVAFRHQTTARDQRNARGNQEPLLTALQRIAQRFYRATILRAVLGELRKVMVESKMDDGIRAPCGVLKYLQIVERAKHRLDALGPQTVRLLLGAGQSRDLMSGRLEFIHHMCSDPTGRTCHEHAH